MLFVCCQVRYPGVKHPLPYDFPPLGSVACREKLQAFTHHSRRAPAQFPDELSQLPLRSRIKSRLDSCLHIFDCNTNGRLWYISDLHHHFPKLLFLLQPLMRRANFTQWINLVDHRPQLFPKHKLQHLVQLAERPHERPQ